MLTVGSAANGQPATPTAPNSESAAEAAFQFTLAKSLAEEGSFSEADRAFSEAIRLAPDEPYLRIEYGQFLARLARGQRRLAARHAQLTRAAEQVDAARRLAPHNADVLRAVSDVYLALAEGNREPDPLALSVARKALEEVRKQDPEDIQSLVTLGQIYLREQHPDKAAEVFSEVTDYAPTNRAIYSMLYDARRLAGQGPEAEAALKRLVELDPTALDKRLQLADLEAARGDHAAALATLEAAPKDLRDAAAVQRKIAWELFQLGRLDDALRIADELLGGRTDDVGLVYLKALLLAEKERYDEAAGLIRRLESSDRQQEVGGAAHPAAAEGARLELARVLSENGHWDRALQVLAPLLDSSDDENRTRAVLGSVVALEEGGHLDEALSLLEAHTVDVPAASGLRVDLLLRKKEDHKAHKLLSSLLREKDPSAALAGIRSYLRLERYGAALPFLEKVVAAHPGSVDALFMLASTRERTGDADGAAKAFEQLLAQQPDDAQALNYLGYMWAERGENLDRALELIERAVKLEPDNGAYVDSLGWVHFQLGQYDQARTYLEKAAKLEPGDSTIYEHLGDVYARLGETTKAAEFYRKALELSQDNADQVRRKLQGLPRD